jgi:hypothetical protein
VTGGILLTLIGLTCLALAVVPVLWRRVGEPFARGFLRTVGYFNVTGWARHEGITREEALYELVLIGRVFQVISGGVMLAAGLAVVANGGPY